MKGEITHEPIGNNGFGYDPIFKAESQKLTNAQLLPAQKNEISHRKMALKKFIAFFEEYTVELNQI